MTDKILDRLSAAGQTINAATLKLTEYLVPAQGIVQVRSRIVGINLASVSTNDRGTSAVVTTTVMRKAAGGPVFIGGTSVQVDYVQTDAAFSTVVYDYQIVSNQVELIVTGVNTYTLQWFATSRPLNYTP